MDVVAKELIKLRHEQEEKATQMLATRFKVGYVDLLLYQVAPEVLKIIPKEEAIKHQMVVYLRVGKKVKVATPVPLTDRAKEWLTIYMHRLGYQVDPALCSVSSYAAAIAQYSHLPVEKTIAMGQTKQAPVDFGRIIKSVKDVAEQAKKVTTSDLFSLIMAGAVNTDSSDIHIEPAEQTTRLRYRIDGVLQDVAELSHEQYIALLSRIKILAQLKLDIKDKPQDGRFEFQSSGKTIDLRTSTLPSSFGEAVVMRLLIAGELLQRLDQLEFPEEVIKYIKEAISKPHGMIINTGPTGSGKTTTLYSILGELNKPGVKIITIEDPVEYRLPGVDQTQVNPAAGYTFALGLKGALRQDPDIIMVGEIRDPETAKIALQAALTGHLVLTTLHANSASAALPRLLDMGVEPFLLAGSINLIIAQRLVRRICPACQRTGTPESLGLPPLEPDLASSSPLRQSARFDESKTRRASFDEASARRVSEASDSAGLARLADLSRLKSGTMPNQPPRASSVGQTLASIRHSPSDDQQLTTYNLPAGKAGQQSVCRTCQGTKYRGRTPIVEALVPTHGFNELIARKATVEEFEQKAKDLGMKTMYENGIDKVHQGITTQEEIERVTRE